MTIEPLGCQCLWHTKWYNPYMIHIQAVPEESKQFFSDMFEEMCELDFELSMHSRHTSTEDEFENELDNQHKKDSQHG